MTVCWRFLNTIRLFFSRIIEVIRYGIYPLEMQSLLKFRPSQFGTNIP